MLASLSAAARALSRLARSPSPRLTMSATMSGSALWSAETPNVINLGKGHPSPNLLPLSELRNAFDAASKRPNAHVTLMQYGLSQGNLRLRQLIAGLFTDLTDRPAAKLSPDHILITTGSGPALSLVCQLYSKPGDTIFIDAPGYFLAYYSFRDCHLNMVEIPTDHHGLQVDLIEQRLQRGERPSLVYTVPIANNPTGVSMSDARKLKLLHLSRQYGFKIAADEVYQFLTFDQQLPSSLFEYDDPSNPTVFALNSFSKILGPGLRVGWVTTSHQHIKRMLDCGPIQSGGGLNPFASAVVCEMIQSKVVHNQIHALRSHYKLTSSVLCQAIDEYIRPALRPGEDLHFHTPVGGFFCFVTLPQRINAEKLLDIAKPLGVFFFTGPNFSSDKSAYHSCIRLCFAFVTQDEIKQGVRRIADAIAVYNDTY